MPELELKDFIGIVQDTAKPPLNSAADMYNIDLRDKTGVMKLRSGYTLLYDTPKLATFPNSKISNLSIVAFESVTVTSAGVDQDVIVLVATGTVAGMGGVSYPTPASINTLLIFSSHYWDGSAWQRFQDSAVDDWYLMNAMVLTKIKSAPSTNQLTFDYTDNSYALDNWYVHNVTKGETTTIVKYDVDPIVTLYGYGYCSNTVSDWSAGDTVIIMRNYIPYTELTAMSSVTSDDVSFHKVLDGLRIAFGGKADRLALAVSYNKKYFIINKFDAYGSATSGEVQGASKVDGLVLTPISPYPYDNVYNIRITKTSALSSILAAGKYFVQMSVLLDDVHEFVVANSSIELDGTENIYITPFIEFARMNRRIHTIKIYISKASSSAQEATEPYYFVRKINMTNDAYISSDNHVTYNGLLYLEESAYTEKHETGNAASITGEANSVGSWVVDFPSSGTLTTVADPATGGGSYALRYTNDLSSASQFIGIHSTQADLQNLDENENFEISFYIKASSACGGVIAGFFFDITTAYTQISFKGKLKSMPLLPSNGTLNIVFTGLGASDSVTIDLLSFKRIEYLYINSDDLTETVEMQDELGYPIPAQYAKSWDMSIVTQGRVFVINPYFDKRISNKIFVSPLTPAAVSRYDTITDSSYLDLENFDGDDIVGASLLRNMDFLIVKTASVQIVDPNTNQTRDIIRGYGGVSRRSIVNFGDKVAYATEFDILMTNTIETVPATGGTIRSIFRAITAKSGVIAGIEEKGRGYLFYDNGGAISGRSYLYTERGWLKFFQYTKAQEWFASQRNVLMFLSGDKIYKYDRSVNTDDDTSGNAQALPIYWQSQEFDIDLLGPQLSKNFRLHLSKAWINYKETSTPLYLKIYRDGTNLTNTLTCPTTSTALTKKNFKLGLRQKCQKFFIVVTSNNLGVSPSFEIESIGVIWEAIPVGRYG